MAQSCWFGSWPRRIFRRGPSQARRRAQIDSPNGKRARLALAGDYRIESGITGIPRMTPKLA
jgi:hypothetical protein